jgi:hypothetical protein
MSDETNNPAHRIIWLNIVFKDEAKRIVRGPYANNNANRELWIQALKHAKLTDAQIGQEAQKFGSDLSQNTLVSQDSTVEVYTIFEYNKDVATAMCNSAPGPLQLYAVRLPEMVEAVLIDADDYDAETFGEYAVSGGKHFNLGRSIETFLEEDKAYARANEILKSFNSDRSFTEEGFERFLHGDRWDHDKHRRESRVAVGRVFSQDFGVEKMVTVAYITVDDDDEVESFF